MAKFIPYNYSRSHGSAPTEKQLQKWNDTVNIHSEDSFKHVCKEIYDALDSLNSVIAASNLSTDKKQYIKNLLVKEEPFLMQLYRNMSSLNTIINLKSFNKQVAYSASSQYASSLNNGAGAQVPTMCVQTFSLRSLRGSMIVYADLFERRNEYIKGIKELTELAKEMVSQIDDKFKANQVAAKERRKAELLAEVARIEREIG